VVFSAHPRLLTRINQVFNQRELAELFINSQLLRGIRDESDVRDMPAEKRQLALRAMRNAQNSMRICLGGKGVGPCRLPAHGRVALTAGSIPRSFATAHTTPVCRQSSPIPVIQPESHADTA
jgi:hypothetical protein